MGEPTFQIPREIIEPIIQAHVATAVTAALSGREAIIEKAVAAVLGAKVDDRGQPDRYDSRGALTWVQWAMQDAVKLATKDALEKAVKGHEEKIREELAHQMTRRNSPLLKSLVAAMVGNLSNANLRYDVTVSVQEK